MDKEINKQLIKRQAKDILDKFAKALEKVEKEGEESYVDRKKFEREERASSSLSRISSDIKSESAADENSKNLSCGVNNDFKEKILKNAPNHDDDFVIAEKGSWK